MHQHNPELHSSEILGDGGWGLEVGEWRLVVGEWENIACNNGR